MVARLDERCIIVRYGDEGVEMVELPWGLRPKGPDGRPVAVMPVKDELREEEVLACVVLRNAKPGKEMAEAFVRYCLERVAYY